MMMTTLTTLSLGHSHREFSSSRCDFNTPMDENQVEYVAQVFNHIQATANAASQERTLDIGTLLQAIRNFYVSLFSKKTGVFQQGNMDKRLAERRLQKLPRLQQMASPKATSTPKSGTGVGKGSPGIPRKAVVSKRAERARMKRKIELENSTHGHSSPAKIPNVSAIDAGESETSSCSSVASDRREQESSEEQHDEETLVAPAAEQLLEQAITPADEQRDSPAGSDIIQLELELEGDDESLQDPREQQPEEVDIPPPEQLDIQVLRKAAEKRIKLFQNISGVQPDDEPSDKELELFHSDMQYWALLEPGMVDVLRSYWNRLRALNKDPKDMAFLKTIVQLHNMCNGISNCASHMTGFLVRRASTEENTTVQRVTEEIAANFKRLRHNSYVEILARCNCPECSDVIEFDNSYSQGKAELAKRPMHCEDSESLVQLLRATFSGLGESSLQKAQQFYCSTGELSPPTVSLAGPTDVQALTRRYMASYMERRSLTDNMPTTWHFLATAKDGTQANWIKIQKSNLHLFDGDSGEVSLTEQSSDELKKLTTHHNAVRFRLKFHDAPEIDTAIRIYREKEGSTRKQTITTDSIGIRSLRAARELIFNAAEVYFDISDHTQSDVYKRLLVDIWLLNDNAVKSNFAEELARMGCTYPFVSSCMHTGIYNAMLAAKEAERGMFVLPDEVFASPFRPWEIRRHWKGKGTPLPEIYLRYYPVRNVDGETQPEQKWRGQCDLAESDGEEDGEPSQSSDQFHFRLVQSPLSVEALCYKAPSTIGKEAGDGLFLKRHYREIQKGSYLCTYETSSKTEEEINRSASSRTYVLEVESRNTTTSFDAEIETANNLGRFANQPKVIEALNEVVRLSNKSNYQQMTDRDWKEINNMVASACNAVFARKGDALVLLAKDVIPPGAHPIEIFVSYGDMREYWVKHIAECPTRFPSTLSNIVQWLLTSEECNWTDEQKCKWAGKNV